MSYTFLALIPKTVTLAEARLRVNWVFLYYFYSFSVSLKSLWNEKLNTHKIPKNWQVVPIFTAWVYFNATSQILKIMT